MDLNREVAEKVKKITAEEARALTGSLTLNAARELPKIYNKIKTAAEKGSTSIIMRGKIYNTYNDERDWNASLREIVKDLRDHGYTCTTFYEERQFVDLGLKIDWSN
jgi:hypothetical protein